MDSLSFLCIVLFGLLHILVGNTGVDGAIGINYGMLGNNLPPPKKVVSLYKSRKVYNLRLFNPNATVFQALKNSKISVVLGTYNQDLQKLASDKSFAQQWVKEHVAPYASSVKFKYVTAGNEVIPGELADYVVPAIQNLHYALNVKAKFNIPVTTVVATSVLGVSYPPSTGAFSESVIPVMKNLMAVLAKSKAPFLLNVYPYFAYADNPKDVSIDYALFKSKSVVVQDGSYGYKNLFDAIVDATYAAMAKVGGSKVRIDVAETGWPSAGGFGATIANAKAYNNNLVAHIKKKEGTPRKPKKEMNAFLFALFNENLKPAGTEQNFGLYYPTMKEVYHVNF